MLPPVPPPLSPEIILWLTAHPQEAIFLRDGKAATGEYKLRDDPLTDLREGGVPCAILAGRRLINMPQHAHTVPEVVKWNYIYLSNYTEPIGWICFNIQTIP